MPLHGDLHFSMQWSWLSEAQIFIMYIYIFANFPQIFLMLIHICANAALSGNGNVYVVNLDCYD